MTAAEVAGSGNGGNCGSLIPSMHTNHPWTWITESPNDNVWVDSSAYEASERDRRKHPTKPIAELLAVFFFVPCACQNSTIIAEMDGNRIAIWLIECVFHSSHVIAVFVAKQSWWWWWWWQTLWQKRWKKEKKAVDIFVFAFESSGIILKYNYGQWMAYWMITTRKRCPFVMWLKCINIFDSEMTRHEMEFA